MATVTPPIRNDISGTAPNPSNAIARTAFGVLHDYLMNLLGSAGTPAAARTALGAAADGSSIPFRNRALNGDFSIDQEFAGAAVTITAGAALKYVIDGWYAYCTGANVTFQTTTVAGRKRARFTGAASNTAVGFATRVEAANSADMAAAFATLSLLLSSSSITTVNWGLYYANTTDAFGTVATPTRTAIQTGSFTITATEAAYSAITSAVLAAGATTGLELVITAGALLGTQTLTIGDVQVEEGSIASPVFEVVSRPVQQMRCERHVRVVAATIGTAVNATSAIFSINHVGMFAAPSVMATGVLTVTDEIALNYTQASANAAISENTANGGRYSGTFSGMTSGRFANLLTTAGAGRLILAARL